MSETTTEGKSVPEALRMIAEWIEEGREIEYFDEDADTWRQSLAWEETPHLYRAKPRKPRTGFMSCSDNFAGVELTPEVRAVLEREGLI